MKCTRCNVPLTEGRCNVCGRPVQRFTDRARQVMALANKQAIELHRLPDPLQPPPRLRIKQIPAVIRPAHLLLAIASGPQGVGGTFLDLCVPVEGSMRRSVLMRLTTTRPVARSWFRPSESLSGRLALSAGMRRLIERACEEAWSLGHDWVGTEHLLLALCTYGDPASRRALRAHGVDAGMLRELIVENLMAVYTKPPPLPS